MKDKIKIIICLVVCAIIVAFTIYKALDYAEKEEYNHKMELSKTADSLAIIYNTKEESLNLKIYNLEEQVKQSTHERDSLREYAYTNVKTNKQIIKTVYKDSIKEVYIENNEIVSIYENTISRLRDSLSVALSKKDGVEVQYVEKIVHDTIIEIHTKVDSVYVESESKVVKDNKSNWGVYGNGHVGYGTNGFVKEADVGVKYFIIGPIYGNAGVKYNGDVSGIVGLGLDYRF